MRRVRKRKKHERTDGCTQGRKLRRKDGKIKNGRFAALSEEKENE